MYIAHHTTALSTILSGTGIGKRCEVSRGVSSPYLPSLEPSAIPTLIADSSPDDDAMDVDEEWTSPSSLKSSWSSSRALSSDETESDEMDMDVDPWLDEVEDVEMMDVTEDSGNVQPLPAFEAPWLEFVNHLWCSPWYQWV